MLANEPTWTVERIELLKNRFEAGLTCREIACDIGVSRNAVIGKLSRLNLTRDKRADAPRTERKSAAKAQGRSRTVPRLQYQLLRALYAEPEPVAVDEPIHNGHTCSLLELSEARCRWPINTPGSPTGRALASASRGGEVPRGGALASDVHLGMIGQVLLQVWTPRPPAPAFVAECLEGCRSRAGHLS